MDAAWIPTMAPDPVVFALANPDPEVDVDAAGKFAAVLATGRSDYPNQINNVLAFPGVFRGLLDARAAHVTTPMLLSAARALAACVSDAELNAAFVVPSVFDPACPPRWPPRSARPRRPDRGGVAPRRAQADLFASLIIRHFLVPETKFRRVINRLERRSRPRLRRPQVPPLSTADDGTWSADAASRTLAE